MAKTHHGQVIQFEMDGCGRVPMYSEQASCEHHYKALAGMILSSGCTFLPANL